MVATRVGAIVVAAGSSRRMGGIDKLWIDLDGAPLLARTLAAIATTPSLGELVLAAGPETTRRVEDYAHLPVFARVDRWVQGGATRQDSVYNALQALAPCDLVLIHDGARPLVSTAAIARGVSAAQVHGAVIAATPVTDTIKVVDGQERIAATPARETLRAAQTPQIFRYELLCEAYRRVGAARAQCTDDGGVVELAGMPVYTFLGETTNMKVSTPADIAVVRALWAMLKKEAGA
jgi:2-C-methyl-D-erythritol 4-phosphate cytidylyltransferase